ncbi:hypothetical protein [Meinhardsimonia xiamenensis]|uniref:hypothetical protein n=1 Tax=Meinhardsimonia xiamenensis TaxID=990712 RepID=UPI0020112746|nr:hypothetical protein [Meinhardsimonia xiamenensis]
MAPLEKELAVVGTRDGLAQERERTFAIDPRLERAEGVGDAGFGRRLAGDFSALRRVWHLSSGSCGPLGCERPNAAIEKLVPRLIIWSQAANLQRGVGRARNPCIGPAAES